jgi:hypothetical protein
VSESKYRVAGLSVQSRIKSYGFRSTRAFVGTRASAIASTQRRELTLQMLGRQATQGCEKEDGEGVTTELFEHRGSRLRLWRP